MFLFLLTVITLLLTAGAVPVPLLTIHSPDGDLIDCIDRLAQPAFSHPFLLEHKLQETPTRFPKVAKQKAQINWQIWHGNGTKCPDDTIHVRRVTKSPEEASNPTKGHEYAIGYIENPPKIYGARARMNVWQPTIADGANEFSLGQIWLVSGSYKTQDLNSIEAGWQVYPQLYMDKQPRFFIFWTRDAYNIAKFYNLRCPGFVQTSSTIVIEGAISPPSIYGGPQTDLTIEIWKDANLGLWWLAVGLNNGTTLETVGYWPTEIFTRLTEFADMVQWGGEIVNTNTSGRHTITEMGAEYFPDNSSGAYMRYLGIVVNKTVFQPAYNLVVGATNPRYYKAKKSSNTSFYYGGQEHAKAVCLRLDLVFVFVALGLFLVF